MLVLRIFATVALLAALSFAAPAGHRDAAAAVAAHPLYVPTADEMATSLQNGFNQFYNIARFALRPL